jgi:hypothetical protein
MEGATNMVKEYKYDGEIFQLDDSKGCYIEVTYKDMTGYVGVNLGNDGSAGRPYVWWAEDSDPVVADGLNYGNPNGSTQESNLGALCNDLIRRQRQREVHAAFDREAACKALHDFVEKL